MDMASAACNTCTFRIIYDSRVDLVLYGLMYEGDLFYSNCC